MSVEETWRLRTIGELVDHAAQRFGARTAWTFPAEPEPQRTWTFEQVRDAARSTAARLQRRTSGAGARVAVMVGNRPAFPLLWLGCAYAGLVCVPIHTKSGRQDAGHILRAVEAELIVVDPALEGLAAQLVADLDDPPAVVLADDLVHGDPGDPGDPEPWSSRLLNIQFTSGTTGLPKGCMLAHRYWLEIARSLCFNHPRIGADDVLYTAQPFSYMDPQWNVATALLAGAQLVVAEKFSASGMWAQIRQHQVTVFYCLGIMPGALLAQPPHPDDRNHRVRAVLASGIPPRLHAELENRWGAPWFEAFGMTESGADLVVDPADHDIAVGTACLGRPHPGREVVVLGPSGTVLPDGSTGELAVRGAGLMDGYWRDASTTAAKFRDGWLLSGDLVRTDPEGRFYYQGRLKEMIRRSGENISAAQVEQVIGAHPAVRAVGVIGVPDELAGEEVKAFVVLDDPDPSRLPAIAEYCRRELAEFKVPRYWALRDELPLTPSERVAKGELRADRGPFVDSRRWT